MSASTLVYEYIDRIRELNEAARRLDESRERVRAVLHGHDSSYLGVIDAGEFKAVPIVDGLPAIHEARPLLYMSDLKDPAEADERARPAARAEAA
jgi:hypothetical protein